LQDFTVHFRIGRAVYDLCDDLAAENVGGTEACTLIDDIGLK
jgi:hypothetical protein